MSTEQYVDITQFDLSGEDIPADAQIEDPSFTTRRLEPVGLYDSAARSAAMKKVDGGHLSVCLTFTGGLTFVESGKMFFKNFPLKDWIDTKPREEEGGITSRVAGYLRACGIDPKGLGISGVKDAIQESLVLPVRLYLSIRDRSEKQPDGSWLSRGLNAADFNVGTKENPKYVPQITLADGTVVKAKHFVRGYRKIS